MHYASGTYFIISVQDQVSSAGFIQTLTLFKNSNTFTTSAEGTNEDSEIRNEIGVTMYTPNTNELQKVSTSSLSDERVRNSNNNNIFSRLGTNNTPITRIGN